MTESMGRWAAAVSLAIIVGLTVILALSPHVGVASGIIGLVAAIAVAVGVARRYQEMMRR